MAAQSERFLLEKYGYLGHFREFFLIAQPLEKFFAVYGWFFLILSTFSHVSLNRRFRKKFLVRSIAALSERTGLDRVADRPKPVLTYLPVLRF